MSDGELPRAVASGGELAEATTDVLVPVEPRRVAAIVGVMAAAYVLVLLCVAAVPTRVLALFGVPGDDLGRYGGLRMSWQPPPDLDRRALERSLEGREQGLRLEPAADGYIVLVPGVAPDAIETTAQRIGGAGRLEFHEVIETSAMEELAGVLHLPMKPHTELDLDVDSWQAEAGPRHTDYFLRGPSREALADKLAVAADSGWKLPAGTHIAYEHVRPRGPDDLVTFWRTYVIADDAALDGAAIADARGEVDPNTGRATVLVDFDRDGAEKFGDLTSRIVGHKLAIVLDGEVQSAPVIEGTIRGGRAMITVGAGSQDQQVREQQDLVTTLRAGALPRGGHVVSASYVAGAETPAKRWAARLALAIVAYVGCASIWLPGVVGEEVEHMLYTARHVHWLGGVQLSIVALGLTPIITSAVLVEIIASIVPRWRRLRDGDGAARRKLGLATAIVTIVLAAVQAYFVVVYIRSLDRSGAIVVSLTPLTKWAMLGSLVGGTLVLAWLASVITRKGLGNGYAVLIAARWLLGVLDPLDELDASHLALAIVTIACVATIVLGVLRWRVRGLRSAAIPVPATGMLPLSSGGGVIAIVTLLASLGLADLPYRAATWLDRLQLLSIGAVAVVVASVLWSFAFARPGRRAGELARADLRPTSREMWVRATALAAVVLLVLFAVGHVALAELPALRVLDAVDLAVAVAVLADLWHEARDRRRGLVLAWQLHDPLLADVVRDRLDAAGIDHHLQASRLRTLLSPLAAYVPIGVLVADDRVADAERELRAVLIEQ